MLYNARRKVFSAALTSLFLLAAIPSARLAHAQPAAGPPMPLEAVVKRYVEGRALQRKKDYKGALDAYLEAANAGYPPAQRRLGEIYDRGSPAVKRNYKESLRWYELARAGGEDIPKIKPRMPMHPVD